MASSAVIILFGSAPVPVLNVMMTALLAIVLCYTLLGGMVSVVVTDYMQFIVLSVGVGLSTLFIFHQVGLGAIAEAVVSHRGDEGLSPFLNTNYGGLYLLWNLLLFLTASATWQTAAMRVSATRDAKTAMQMYRWSSLTWMGRAIVPMFWGCAALALFGVTHDDPALGTLGAMPRMLAQVVPVGIIGILVAGMLAAFMSTHDSYLLAWSSVLTQDVIAPLCRGELSQKARLAITRFLIILIGIFLLVWGLWYKLPGTMWDYLATTGTMYLSGTLALMVCGMYWKRANVTGAYCAIALGIIFPVLQLFVNPVLTSQFPEFVEADLRNSASLVAELRQPDSPVSEDLRGRLSPAMRGRIDRQQTSEELPSSLQEELVEELNEVLRGGSVYDARRFAGVKLSKKAARMLKRPARGKRLTYRNRLLLADAYPQELARDRTFLSAGIAGLLAYIVAMAGMIIGSLYSESRREEQF